MIGASAANVVRARQRTSVDPSISPAQIEQIIKATAHPFQAGECNRPGPCGAGLIDAYEAVKAAMSMEAQPPSITISPSSITSTSPVNLSIVIQFPTGLASVTFFEARIVEANQDVTAELVGLLTSFTDTQANFAANGVAFPSGTQFTVQISITTTGGSDTKNLSVNVP